MQLEDDKAWYETIFGIIVISLAVNLFSNYMYDKGKNAFKYYKSGSIDKNT